MTSRLTNWAGNLEYKAERLHAPESIERVQEIVRDGRSLRVLGSRHSFNDIADSTADLVSLALIPRTVLVDGKRRSVTIDGGIRYGEVCGPLEAAGFALHNLASLPHISVAGASATATHGSGDRNGNLATSVSAIELIRADGEIVSLARDRNPDEFEGAVVSLGGLGVITRLTLDIEPTFRVRQDVYDGLPVAALLDHFDALTSSADSVSFFTNWREPTVYQAWFKRRVVDGDQFEPPPELFGARRATVPRHPIEGMSTDACTEQLGSPGPWFERLPHFRMDHTPSSGAELQSEYFVPREHGLDGALAISRQRDRIAPLLQVSEIRTVAADGLWMSPTFRRASVAFHFTWRPDWPSVREILPLIEAALAPFDARPHWGKLFTMPPDELRSRYEKLPQFLELLRAYDPDGTFRNDYMNRYIVGPGG